MLCFKVCMRGNSIEKKKYMVEIQTSFMLSIGAAGTKKRYITKSSFFKFQFEMVIYSLLFGFLVSYFVF